MFGISRQALYQQRRRDALRQQELVQLKARILEIRRRMPRIGTRKLYYLLQQDLTAMNMKIGRDALFSYLRTERLLIRPVKSYTKTTFSKHWLHKHSNHLKEMNIYRPEQVFVSDITYIKSAERTHYLSLVTDAYSRKIVGYKLSDDMGTENVVQALKMAIANRKTKLPLIHHSDRGLQYCSQLYQGVLSQNNITPSMTDGYDCYQNALAERINGILKQEFLLYKCKTTEQLEQLVKESVEIYNSDRPHLSLQMKTPNFVHEKTCEDILTRSI